MAQKLSQSIDLEKFYQNHDPLYYEDVEEKLNIAYINRGETPLAMDIFKPVKKSGTELPVIVAIHGGGLTTGSRSVCRPMSRFLAHQGYLVFSLEYRLAPRANVCQQLDDVCAGMDIVGKMLVDYDVDFSRIFLVAESAGAYLATYVVAMHNSKVLQDAIGYEASRFVFKAIGLCSGMFYTNRNDPSGWLLSEQIYGEKLTDENFLQYMNPEHPEIIDNLVPTYLMTSNGDFLNNYTLMMNEALKRAGKTRHLCYYADNELQHAFIACQTDNPKVQAAIKKMLDWFEEQAKLARISRNDDPEKRENELRAVLAKGDINNQRIWQYVKERATFDRMRMSAPAIFDCTRTYTYSQMFDKWDDYARVLSALGITDEAHSRVGLAGSIAAETLFAFYALNMTGAEVSMMSYPDFQPGGQWKEIIAREHITDLILSDILLTPQTWNAIQKEAEKLGLRHIILLHSLLGGPTVGPAELVFNEFNHHALKRMDSTVFMDDLIKTYSDAEIHLCKGDGEQLAIITHTSGSTKGVRKPLPYTDKRVNTVASEVKGINRQLFPDFKTGQRIKHLLPFDTSSFMCMVGTVDVCFCEGDSVVLTGLGFMHPKFIRAIPYYQVDILSAGGFMIDSWMKQTDLDDVDLSCLKIFNCGGSFTSKEKLDQYRQFLSEHGYRNPIIRGYGMSEAGSAGLLADDTCDADCLGYPVPKEDFRILDEEDGLFYSMDGGVRTGVLYITSNTMACNTLDGETLFKLTEIDGRPFLCTNDVVRLNENGSLSYAGRSDRFFVNNEGVRFESGLVETQLNAHSQINKCVIVPILEKRIHDTVPLLYVIPEQKGYGAEMRIQQALKDVFINNPDFEGSALPVQFVIVDSIPYNVSGKIDVYKITRDRLKGSAYDIKPVYIDGKLTDIRIEAARQISSITTGSAPAGMEGKSAFDAFDLFNAPVNTSLKWLSPKKQWEKTKEYMQFSMPFMQITSDMHEEMKAKMKEKMEKTQAEMSKNMQDVAGFFYSHKKYPSDFED